MAASNESVGVWQVGTIGCALLAVILGISLYFAAQHANEQKTAAAAALAAEKDASQNLRKLATGVEQLKELIGFNSAELAGAQTAVFEQTTVSMDKNAGSLRQSTVDATLQAMAAEVQRLNAEIASLESNLNDRDQRLRSIETSYQNRVDEAVGSQRGSEQELQKKTRDMEDRIADKDSEIDTWRKDYEKARIEIETLADTLQTVRDEKDKVIARLTQRVEALAAEVNQIRNVTFEVADGLIRSVDAVQGICTIDLGSADGLPPQTNFSVYKKNNAGIGRGLEDVKGAIEVTRILGPHQAEARILDQDIYDPISPKDPIYSPLWQEGQVEHFAFIGKLDLNRDGTDDRELLFRIIENAGAKVDFYVNEEAARVPDDGAISERTKFLVLGELPNPNDYANRDKEYDNALAVRALQKELDNEALQYGKRVISLPDFLSYIGYKPTQRSFRPGSGASYLLDGESTSDGQKARPLLDTLPKK